MTVDYHKQTQVWFHPEYHKRGHYIMNANYYGVDVSKDHLDIAWSGRVERIENTKRGIKKFFYASTLSSLCAEAS